MSEIEVRVLGAGEVRAEGCHRCGCEADYRVVEVVAAEDLCEACTSTRLALEGQLLPDERKDDG